MKTSASRLSAVAAMLLLLLSAPARAEVVEYRLGDLLSVPCPVNEPGHADQMRTVILLGVAKAAIKGTWSTEDCQVLLNGNVVRIGLLKPTSIPIGILADNGQFYQLNVSPAPASSIAPSILTVVTASAGSTDGGSAPPSSDPQQRAGGHWEHEVNLVLKLHKHIRGGRPLAGVTGVPAYNQQRLREDGRRVPGAVWHASDDWNVVEYYTWSLDRVQAHFIGITYTGRQDTVDFNYQQQVTDHVLAIWHQDRPGDRQVYTRKLPQVRLTRGQEEYFIEYTLDPQGAR